MRLLSHLGNEAGFILAGIIALILGAAAILSILGFAVKGSEQYNHFHQLASDVAANPNSHTNEEILNGGQALVDMMNQTTQGGAIVPGTGGGMGVRMLLQAEDALNKVRNQQYVIKITPSPADPAPKQAVTVTITVLNSLHGTAVSYSLSGTDGYSQSGTLYTDQNGQVSFVVPGGAQGVVDTISVTAGSVTAQFTYTF